IPRHACVRRSGLKYAVASRRSKSSVVSASCRKDRGVEGGRIMPVFLSICAVIVTIAIAAIAAATVRSSNRLVKSLDELKRLTQDVEQLVESSHQIISSARDVVQPLRRVAERFEGVGDRAASLSEAVLGELERPLFNAVAFTRGIRSGAAFFFDRLNIRFKQGRETADGRVLP